jgi:hypothetical protein
MRDAGGRWVTVRRVMRVAALAWPPPRAAIAPLLWHVVAITLVRRLRRPPPVAGRRIGLMINKERTGR